MKSNKTLVTILSIVAVVLLAIVGYFGYKLLTDDKEEENQNIDDNMDIVDYDEEEGEETGTDTNPIYTEPDEDEDFVVEEPPQSTIPAGWTEQTSEAYGYTIGVPDTWYFRYFGGTKSIGLDPDPIPEASEYAGVITFTADTGSIADVKSNYTGGLVSTSETTTQVNSKEWQQFLGMTPSDDVFFPDMKVIHSFYGLNGYVYKLTMMTSPENYNSNLVIYNQILESISFAE